MSGVRKKLTQPMWIEYLDGTNVKQGFENLIWFEDSGIDIVNEEVLDWNKTLMIEPTIIMQTPLSIVSSVHSRQAFWGFSIYNGTSDDLNFVNGSYGLENSGWGINVMTDENEIISEMVFTNETYKIGELIINPGLITFDVNINSTAGNSTEKKSFPVTLSFELRHNSTESSYKY